MASYTPNLNLLKKDPVADGNDFFNIKTMMNDNWDKIYAKVKAALDDIGDLQSEQVRIATGSYVGTGTYGSSNPCSLTFDFVPRAVICASQDANNGQLNAKLFWFYNFSNRYDGDICFVISLSGKTLSWYYYSFMSGGDAQNQLNVKGAKYHWFAIG